MIKTILLVVVLVIIGLYVKESYDHNNMLSTSLETTIKEYYTLRNSQLDGCYKVEHIYGKTFSLVCYGLVKEKPLIGKTLLMNIDVVNMRITNVHSDIR